MATKRKKKTERIPDTKLPKVIIAGNSEITPQENTFFGVAGDLYASIMQLIEMNLEAANNWTRTGDTSMIGDVESALEQGYALSRLLRQAQETGN